MIKRFFILLLAIVASVGMSWASVTWISDQYGNEKGYNAGTPFTKDGVTVTMSDNAFFNVSYWGDASLQCIQGTFDPTAGNYVFSNSLGENFVKIIIAAGYPSDWESFPKGDGWVLSGDEYNGYILTWTGNASTVTLMDNELHSVHQSIEGDIVFYFESDSEDPAPANSCGNGLTWELNNGELVISYDGEGTGVMNDYDIPNDNFAPWYANRENITSVSFPDGIKTIGKDAFRDCVNLTTVTIPNSVTTIGESAFVSVEHLETVTIGTGITSIVNGAFYGNAELTTVTCSATTPPSIGLMVFDGCPNLEHIYVPAESVDAYKTAWSAYASLISAAGGGSTAGIPCTAADLGKVLCTDGSIYATVSDATAASKTAVAMIAYVDTENGKALALALADESGTMDWETAKTTAVAHTPAVSGGTWTLASKDDWNNMITAAGDYTALRDGFSAVGGTNMQQAAYWSSTPENANAWRYYFTYGGMWTDGYVDNPCYVRACLTFDIPAAAITPEAVVALIQAIGTVELTAECKAKIDAARAAYDALSDGDKDLVTNYETLTQAETDYAALAAAAAAPVIAQIEALPTAIKLSTYYSTYDLMVAARAAYNALSAEVQAAVTNLSKLTNLEAAFAAIGGANEKLSKPFSVGEGQVVYFSHGNLQATYNGTNWSWAFAAHQYDYIGDTSGNIIINGNGTLSGAGTVDLFGWVANSSTVLTSGVAKYGVSNSDNVIDYGLGTTETLKGDWGVAANDANIGGYNDWRILSNDEWVYLFKTRTDAASKYGYATVDGKNGVIILPDAFTDPMKNKGNLAFRPQNVDKGYSTNVYTTGGDWEAMEAAGAVFMPAAGRRAGTAVTINEGTGFYWSSTPMSYQASYFMGFMGSNVVPDNDRYRYHGLSVRLVSNNAPVASTPLDSALVVKDLIEAIPAEITLEDACVKAINDAREAYNKLSEAAKGLLDEATLAKLTDAEAALTALYQAEADKVVAKINAIPTPVELKLATRDSIESARAAYEALNAEQKALVTNYDVLEAAEADLATLNPGGGMPAGALNGKFTINAGGDQIAFSKGNLQATTEDLGANWTWSFAAHQWDNIGIEVANNKINGNGTVSENGTVDLFGWSTIATYYGINNSEDVNDYLGEFKDWGTLMGTGWRTLTKDEWSYLREHSSNGKATVNDKNGYIFLPDNWSGPDFTANPSNWTTNVYSGDDWTAMENAGAVFLPHGNPRVGIERKSTIASHYWSATRMDVDPKYAYAFFFSQYQAEAYMDGPLNEGCLVRLVAVAATPSPLDSAQHVKDLIEAIPAEITLEDACVNAVQAARDAYDALSEAAQGALDDATVQKLNQAITDYTALIQAGADAVTAKIALLPNPVQESDLKLSVYQKVQDARAAYDALTADQKLLVTNLAVLEAAEAAFAAIGGGGGVPTVVVIYKSEFTSTGVTKEGVNLALSNGSMTADDMLAMDGSFEFSTSLGKFTNITIETDVNIMNISEGASTSAGWPTGTNLGTSAAWTGNSESVLIDCMVAGNAITITCTVAPASVIADAIAARDLINAIPDPVTLEDACVNAIQSARAAVTALGENASLIDASDMTKLTDAEAALTALNQAEADKVIAKINNIPTPVTLKLATRDSINNARAAYDALTADQKALVSNYQTLLDAEEALAGLNPGGGMPAGALNGKFSINADGDQIAFSKGNLQATTTDLGANWTWGFAANQWNYLGIAVANSKINGNGTVSENGTVDLFGWSTAATYYGINNSYKAVDYIGDFVDWGPNMGAGWRTLTKDEWNYLIENNTKGRATVNDKNGYIFLPDNWSGPAFTPDPDNFTTNVYSGDDWTAMENAGAVFLPSGPARNGTSALIAMDAKYCSSTSLNNDTSYVFTIYYNQSQSACTGTNRAYGCMVRLVTEGGGATPLDSAQAVKDLIDAIPVPVTLDSKDEIDAARDAYDALADLTKGALDDATVTKLTDAEDAYAALIKEATDVIALTNAIPQPVVYNEACGDSIIAARNAYDALSDELKPLVTNYPVLTDAEDAYEKAKAAKEAAEPVIVKINNIPQPVELKLATRDSIQAAREAYDALIDDQMKDSVTNYQTLLDAEEALAGLNPGGGAPSTELQGDGSIENPYLIGGLEAWNAFADAVAAGVKPANAKLTNNIEGVTRMVGNFTNYYTGVFDGNGFTITMNIETNLDSAGLFRCVKEATFMNLNLEGTFTTSRKFAGSLVGAQLSINTLVIKNVCSSVAMTLSGEGDLTSGGIVGLRLSTIQITDCLFKGSMTSTGGGSMCGGIVGYSSFNLTLVRVIQAGTYNLNTSSYDGVFVRNNDANLNAQNCYYINGVGGQSTCAAATQITTDQLNTQTYVDLLQTGKEETYWVLKDGVLVWNHHETSSPSPLDSAQHVKDLIEAIPDPVTLDEACVKAIEDARAAYDALSEAAQGALDAPTVQKLTDAEADLTALNQAVADEVIAKINNIPLPVELKLATRDSINNARTAYDALNAAQQALVTNYQTLLDAEATMATLNPGVPPATPLDSAQAVKDLIALITQPVVYTPACGAEIAAALEAYDALSDDAKGALDTTDVKTLTDAETLYPALEAIAAIEAIPDSIYYDPNIKSAIEIADSKYNALSDESKALVSDDDVHKLTNALEAWAILVVKYEHNVSYMGKDGELHHETVVLRHLPDPAPEFNGYEFLRWDVKGGDFLEDGLRVKAVYKPLITTDPAAYDSLVYNGTEQTLISAGVAKEGHIEYRLNDGEWSNELPKATFAAAYVVYYKLVREGYPDYIADSIVAMIAKAPVAYVAPKAVDSLVYNASNQTLIQAGQTADGTFEYSLTPDVAESWSTELPKAMNADTIGVYYRVIGDLNHMDSTAVDPVKAVIAKAALTATAESKNVIYGDAVPAYTITYAGWQGEDTITVLSGEIAYACAYAPTSNVGEYTITPSGVSAANYSISFVDGKVTVAKATLTVTAEDKNVIYGDSVPAYTATYSGFKNSDDASVVSNLAYICAYAPTSNVGEYVIVPDSATAQNYAFVYVNGTLTVNKAALMITAEDKNVTYGDAVPTYTATYSGWKNSDDASVVSNLVYTCAYAPTSNVGEYAIVPDSATAQNYAISYTNGKVTVGKAALMITAEDKSVIYGDAAPEYTAAYSGWKNNDDATVVSNLAYTCAYAPTSNVGEYAIVPNSATAQNYAITYTNGKVTVAKATLTVTAENKTVTYGDAAPAFTATYSGFKNTDDANVVSNLAYTCAYLVTSNVGDYTITPHSATALNYTFVYVNGTLTVNQAPLSITADNKTVEYGEEHPEFTASYSGWKNSDDASVVSNLAYACDYLVTSNVGNYTITPHNATAMNYAISYTNGTLTVSQAPLMITADNKSVEYGEIAPTFTASYSGWKNTDDASVVSGLTLTSEYLVTSNVGTYDIVPANASATNYAISYTNGTLTVNKAPLTITAENKEMIYGDEHPEFTASYSGWKNTDDESVVSNLAYTCVYAPGSYIGTYAINPNSASAQNYAITFVDGTLTVNKAVVSISGAEAQVAKFADGHANAVVLQQGTLNGIKLNDPIAHVTTAAYSSAAVSENLTITLFYELTGDAALLTNYDLQPTSEIFSTEGVIIEPFIPNDEHQPEEGEQVEVEEGIDVYAYGYCDGSGYSLKYHLNSGNPDQYKIDFADSRFDDIDWTNLMNAGKDGTIEIEIPVDLPTGDYSMTVYFRDSRFTWLESQALTVTFHVNLPETFVKPIFDNTIILVDTCDCFTDIQWYHRNNSSEPWQPIAGATGHYYHSDSKLTGEYFVSAKMNGVPTYTCGQEDMETLYGADQKQKAQVRAYPNPVITKTNVVIEGSANYEHNLRVIGLMGNEVINTTFEGNETVVDMSGYVQGNYMISVDGIVVKVMKQ